jgi:hypothetical protein
VLVRINRVDKNLRWRCYFDLPFLEIHPCKMSLYSSHYGVTHNDVPHVQGTHDDIQGHRGEWSKEGVKLVWRE